MMRVALAVVIAGTLLGLGACGGDGESEVASPPDPNGQRAVCPATEFSVDFDPEGGASLTTALGNLASATLDGFVISKSCETTFLNRDYSDAELAAEPLQNRGDVVCEAPGEIEIDVHPIVDPSDAVVGSNLIVTAGDTPTMIVSAVLKSGGSRLHYSASRCTATAG
jgi:hypothetical protein